ncbi:MAG TPA: LysM peptidoglycan-binding domain-containing protein [Anaerolineaceae bacterium]|nr:LysM peptidoglycan-binding domain-containing protein [Anaerolineaceae bacterium]
MTVKRNIFSKIGNLLKKEKANSGTSGDSLSSSQNPLEEKPDLLETKMSEADHDKSDFTTGLNASRSPIASSQRLELNGDRFLAAHLVGFKDTLSGIAFKYYGKASEPYYRLIYEANKEIIGPNLNLLRAGQTLNIPKLPEDLSKD